MKKVVILQHRLLHYRVELFAQLRAACSLRGIELHLVHGQPTNREKIKRDSGRLDWATSVRNWYIPCGRRDILWQSFPSFHRDADLIILMQENRLLSNYQWLLFGCFRKTKLGFWGHGRNLQSPRPDGILEKWKSVMVGRVDWWFSYTDATTKILLSDNYPADRITTLNNAIDNESFSRDLKSLGANDVYQVRESVGADCDTKIALFCGSLYSDKRLEYMIEAADIVANRINNFRFIIIGDGPESILISEAVKTRHWMKWLGAKSGLSKAQYFRIADVVFNPGAVGLHILDSFCSGVPMITCADSKHGPEISYLRHKENALLVEGGPISYANEVIGLLLNPSRLYALKSGALDSASKYTLQNMVSNFVDGIERCLVKNN